MALRIPSRRQFLNAVVVTESFVLPAGTSSTFSDITVTGTSNLTSVYVSDKAKILGDVTMYHNLEVGGTSSLLGDVTMFSNLEVGGLSSLGNVIVYETLYALSNLFVSDNITSNNITALLNLNSNGYMSVTKDLYVLRDLLVQHGKITGNNIISTNNITGNNIISTNNMEANSYTLNWQAFTGGGGGGPIPDQLTLNKLIITGSLINHGTTLLEGLTTCRDLTVSNLATISNVIIGGYANILGSLLVTSNLTIDGYTELMGNLLVYGTSTLTDMVAASNLTVSSTSTLTNLVVSGYSELIGNLKTSNLILDNLHVNMTSNLQGKTDISNLISCMQASISNLVVTNELDSFNATHISGLQVSQIDFTGENGGGMITHGTSNLQQVCEIGNITTSSITAGSFLCTTGGGIHISDQSSNSIHLSNNSINLSSGLNKVYISNVVAIGEDAGRTNQGVCAIAVGKGSGKTNQGSNAIAIGYQAGYQDQGLNSIAIGVNSVCSKQGSIVIGTGTSPGPNTLIINAGPDPLTPYNGNGIDNRTFISPIREVIVDDYAEYRLLGYSANKEVVKTGLRIFNGGIMTQTGNVITSLMLDKLYAMLL